MLNTVTPENGTLNTLTPEDNITVTPKGGILNTITPENTGKRTSPHPATRDHDSDTWNTTTLSAPPASALVPSSADDTVHHQTNSAQTTSILSSIDQSPQIPISNPVQNRSFPFSTSDTQQNQTTSAENESLPVPTDASVPNESPFLDKVILSSRNVSDCLARGRRLYFSAHQVSIAYSRDVNQAGMNLFGLCRINIHHFAFFFQVLFPFFFWSCAP